MRPVVYTKLMVCTARRSTPATRVYAVGQFTTPDGLHGQTVYMVRRRVRWQSARFEVTKIFLFIRVKFVLYQKPADDPFTPPR